MPKSRGAWIAIAAFVSAVVLAGFWLFAVSPNRTQTAELDEQRSQIAKENATLEAKVSALRSEFAKIEDYRAELEVLQVHLPTSIGDKPVYDRLTELAEASEIQIVTQSADLPTSLLGQIQAEAQEKAAAEEAAKAKDAEAKGDDAPKPAATKAPPEGWAAATVDDLVAVPVAVKITGDYDGVREFVGAVHDSPERYLLVGAPTFTFEADDEGEELVTAEFTLFTFVFTDTVGDLAAALEAAGDDAAVTYPNSSANPFGTHDDK